MKSVRFLPLLALALAACGGSPATSVASSETFPPGSPHRAQPAPDIDCASVPERFPRSVVIALDMTKLRAHPAGRALGPLLFAMPQWRDLLRGTVNDPVNDVDWVHLSGPSMVDSSKDVVYVHYAIEDAKVDHGIEALRKRSPAVVPYDLAVRGATGTFANIDNGPRVVIQAQPRVLAVTPPERAKEVARALVSSRLKAPVQGGEALRAFAERPHEAMPQIPDEVRTAHVVATPRTDGGIDVRADGQCDDPAAAERAAAAIKRTIDRYDNFVTRLLTAGLLGAVHVTTEGSEVRVSVDASARQVQRAIELLTTFLGGDA